MPDEAREPDPDLPSKVHHVSFLERLRRRTGKDHDPGVDLRDLEADDAASQGADEHKSGSARGFFRRLEAKQPKGERYRIGDELARGGMGAIMRVWDEDLRRNLAMKVMLSRGAKEDADSKTPLDEEQLSRFLEEAQITGQLDHPGIVPVHDLGIDAEGRIFFTMRLVRGRELKEIFELAREGREGWTPTRVLQIILRVCEAMAFAHSKGVVHRDLKPPNVMVGRFGETYVMDWGLARVVGRTDSHNLALKKADASWMSLVRTERRDEKASDPDSPLITMDGDVVGTPSYMSPEQAEGRLDEVGPRSDVYSLGAMLYHMLAGHAPYVRAGERVSPHTVLARVLAGPPDPIGPQAEGMPDELVAICEKAMQRSPDARYDSMLDVAEDIQAFLENRVVRAYETGSVAEFRKWVSRNRMGAALAAGLIVTVLASAIGFGWQKNAQVDALSEEKQHTEAQKRRAEDNFERAQNNAELAEERRIEADRNRDQAERSEQLARRSGYTANVIAAAYSLEARDVVEARARLDACEAGLRNWEWEHVSLLAHPQIDLLSRLEAPAVGLALAGDGKTVFAVTQGGRVHAIDRETSRRVAPFDVANPPYLTLRRGIVNAGLAYGSHDGQFALVAADARTRLFDAATGEPTLTLPSSREGDGHSSFTTTVAFEPSGPRIATGAEDDLVLVWDTTDGSFLQRFAGHGQSVTRVAWSPDGSRIASVDVGGELHVWDTETGEELWSLLVHKSTLRDVLFDPQGEHVLCACSEGEVHAFEAATGVMTHVLGSHEGAVTRLAIDETGRFLASGSTDKTIRVRDLHPTWAPPAPREVVLLGHEDDITGLAFVPGSPMLVSCSADKTVLLWDTRYGGAVTKQRYYVGRGEAIAVAHHPSQPLAVTTGSDRSAILWNTDTNEVQRVLRGHERYVGAAAISPDGTRVLTGSGDKTARLWDAETGALLQVFRGHEKLVGTVVFDPAGRWVATGSRDRRVRVWDAETGELLRVFPEQRRAVDALVVAPDSGVLIFGGGDGELTAWGQGTDLPTVTYSGGKRGALSAAISPDGALLAAGFQDSRALVWDARTGEHLLTLTGHSMSVGAIAFSPDGSRLVTGSLDRTLRLWDTVSGSSLLVFDLQELANGGMSRSVTFSPDGERILASSTSGDTLVFETAPTKGRRARLKAAQDLRDQAREHVDAYFEDLFYRGEVVAALQRDARLTDEVREVAIRMAVVRGNDPRLLDETTRQEVLPAGREAQLYRKALDRAEAASSFDAEDPGLRLTLGIAQYRTGALSAAAKTLDDARDGDPRAHLDRFAVLRRAFLAMTDHRLGREDLARTRLTRLDEELDEDEDVVLSEEVSEVLNEAHTTLGVSRATDG
jgi:WD40 repeat protein/serine/threonine protein kinase